MRGVLLPAFVFLLITEASALLLQSLPQLAVQAETQLGITGSAAGMSAFWLQNETLINVLGNALGAGLGVLIYSRQILWEVRCAPRKSFRSRVDTSKHNPGNYSADNVTDNTIDNTIDISTNGTSEDFMDDSMNDSMNDSMDDSMDYSVDDSVDYSMNIAAESRRQLLMFSGAMLFALGINMLLSALMSGFGTVGDSIVTAGSESIASSGNLIKRSLETSNGMNSIPMGVGLALYGMMTPVLEELFFRGLLFNRLRQLIPARTAAVGSGLLFGLYHGNLIQFLYAWIIGCVLGEVYERSGEISFPILLHAIINISAFVLSGSGAVNGSAELNAGTAVVSAAAWGSALTALGAGLLVLYRRSARY